MLYSLGQLRETHKTFLFLRALSLSPLIWRLDFRNIKELIVESDFEPYYTFFYVLFLTTLPGISHDLHFTEEKSEA